MTIELATEAYALVRNTSKQVQNVPAYSSVEEGEPGRLLWGCDGGGGDIGGTFSMHVAG